MIQIKLLTAQDWLIWQKLRLEALQQAPENFASSYLEELALLEQDHQKTLSENDVFVALINDTAVSCAALHYNKSQKTKHIATLWGMYSSEDYQRKNIASAVLNEVIKHAKPYITQLQLKCLVNNNRALTFYQKHGFKIYGTEIKALKINGVYLDQHLMALELI